MTIHSSSDVPSLSAYDAAREIPEHALQIAFVYIDDELVIVSCVVVDVASESEEIAHGVNTKTF